MTVGRGQQILVSFGPAAAAAGLSLDGAGVSATSSSAGATTLSVTGITTTKTNDLLMLGIAATGNVSGVTPAVSSIATAGLTWTKRSSTVMTTANGANAGWVTNMEIWTAPAASLQSSVTALITLNNAAAGIAAGVIPINGCNSISSPFDPHTGLPASAVNTSSTVGVQETATISTTDSPGMVYSWNVNQQGQGVGGAGGPFTRSLQLNAPGSGLGPILTLFYDFVPSAQTNLVAFYGAATDTVWASIWDALH